MRDLVRRLAISVLGATVLAVPLAVATAQEARADKLCTITGFTPRSVTVALSPKVVTFKPTVSGCTLSYWSLREPDFAFWVYADLPKETFSPSKNSEAGTSDVVVDAYNGDFNWRTRTFPDAFRIRRHTTWDKVDASPEPVRKGAQITVKGRLRLADWTKDRYVGHLSQPVVVEFRTASGSYKVIKRVRTGSDGQVSTKVPAVRDGYWRLRYGGSTTAASSTVAGDFVDVK